MLFQRPDTVNKSRWNEREAFYKSGGLTQFMSDLFDFGEFCGEDRLETICQQIEPGCNVKAAAVGKAKAKPAPKPFDPTLKAQRGGKVKGTKQVRKANNKRASASISSGCGVAKVKVEATPTKWNAK